MDFDVPTSIESFRFLSMICALHDCELTDVNLSSQEITVNGSPESARSCKQAMQHLSYRFSEVPSRVDASHAAVSPTPGTRYAVMR